MFLKVQVFFFVLECLGPSYKNEIPECFYILRKFLGWNSEHFFFFCQCCFFSSMIWCGTDFQAFYLLQYGSEQNSECFPLCETDRIPTKWIKFPSVPCSAEKKYFSENDNPGRDVNTNHGDNTKTYKISLQW